MGAGKNQLLRYRIIHFCLCHKQKRYWSINELLEKLTSQDLIIEKRSIERDIESMRHDNRLGYLAPILYCRKEKGYYYSDPNFNPGILPITEKDIQTLTMTLSFLQRYNGTQLVIDFEHVVDKLSRVVHYLPQLIDR